MNNEIKIFEHEQFGSVRTILIDGQPWFVGKDVAKALGYSKSENALQRHVDEEDKSLTPFQGGCSTGRQNTTIINDIHDNVDILWRHFLSYGEKIVDSFH